VKGGGSLDRRRTKLRFLRFLPGRHVKAEHHEGPLCGDSSTDRCGRPRPARLHAAESDPKQPPTSLALDSAPPTARQLTQQGCGVHLERILVFPSATPKVRTDGDGQPPDRIRLPVGTAPGAARADIPGRAMEAMAPAASCYSNLGQEPVNWVRGTPCKQGCPQCETIPS